MGIHKILFLIGYRGEMILERYGPLCNEKIKFSFSHGDADDQTGARLLNAYDQLEDKFLLLYGDNYWPIELNTMTNLYRKKKAKILTTVFGNLYGTGEYGTENNILVDNKNVVLKYDKSRKEKKLNGVDIGYFIVDKNSLDQSSKGKNVSFEEDILPKFISGGGLVAHFTNEQYYYITHPKSLKCFENYVIQNHIKFYQGVL